MTGTTVDTAALARVLYQAFNERRLDDVLAMATEDIELTVIPFGQTFHGHDGFRDFMTGFLNGFSDVQIAEITNQVASGNGVVTEFIASGTHDGPLASPAGEIPATGRMVEYPVVEVWAVRDGKVASLRNYFDSTTVMAQLGLLPE
jgi:steroid delta-isomerase-like uncharacterized protein